MILAEATSEKCQETNLSPQTCGVSEPTSIYSMLFTKCSQNVPRMLNISRNNITYDDLLTIIGTGFSNVICENRVLIGDARCQIISASTTEITCRVGLNSGLVANTVYPVQLAVNNYGFAVKDTLFTVRFFPRVTNFTPTVGSTAGGSKIVITGDGFIPNNTLIIIGTSSYHQSSNAYISNNMIIVETFPSTEATHEIQIFVDRLKAVCDECSFDFSTSVTPRVDSISPISVNKSTTMTINGSFPENNATKVSVKVGDEDCRVISLNSEQLLCVLNGLGLYENKVKINIKGIYLSKSFEVPQESKWYYKTRK